MADPIGSHGTLLKIGDGATPTEAFTTIAGLVDINHSGFERNIIDAPDQQQTWTKKVPGMLNPGDQTFTVNFVPTDGTHDESTGLIKDLIDGTLRNFQLVFPDTGTTTWTFAAYVKSCAAGEPVDGILTMDVVLAIDGDPISG
jgi:hypothetical protein